MHNPADCWFLYLEPDKKETKVASKEECDICHGERNTFECSRFHAYMNKSSSFYDDEYEPSSPVLSETENEELEVTSAVVCSMCYGEHISTSLMVARSSTLFHNMQKIGAFYERCDCEMENDLFCPDCRRAVPGYLGPKSY